MKVVFYASDKPREIMLARALEHGVKAHGDDFEMRRTGDYGEDEDGNDRKFPGPSPDTDVAVCFGVKGKSRHIVEDHRHDAIGKSVLYVDKGFTRSKGEGNHTEYSRVCVNASSPVAYMGNVSRPDDRWRRLGIEMQERAVNQHGIVLYCGSSQKYHEFNRLPSADVYAQRLLSRMRQMTDLPIVYRPKPSHVTAQQIDGFGFEPTRRLAELLRLTHVVVTHGASAAMDAVIAGVAAISLGGSVARPVCATEIDRETINNCFFPSERERWQWACNMAYCQWTNDELRSGEAWQHLRAEIVRQQVK